MDSRSAFACVFAFSCSLAAACGGRIALDATPDPGQPVPVPQGADASVAVPNIAGDSAPARDSGAKDVGGSCADAGTTTLYAVSDASELLVFDRRTTLFHRAGTFECPAHAGATPHSMAIRSSGQAAYLVFTDGKIYRVDLASRACSATPFVPNQHGFSGVFRIAFAPADVSSPTSNAAEAMYAVGGAPETLAKIDPSTFALTVIGPTLREDSALATGPQGKVYMLSTRGEQSSFARLDLATGQPDAEDPLLPVNRRGPRPITQWNGSFWFFPAAPSPPGSDVLEYQPGNQSIREKYSTNANIMGVGVTGCSF